MYVCMYVSMYVCRRIEMYDAMYTLDAMYINLDIVKRR